MSSENKMTITKKIEEKRDELATKLFLKNHSTMEEDFVEGFDLACAILLPEIERLEEALKKITKTKYGLQGYIEENDVQGERDYLANLAFGYEQIARYTLQSLREFLGEESGGE